MTLEDSIYKAVMISTFMKSYISANNIPHKYIFDLNITLL